jgi:hypothetical protein
MPRNAERFYEPEELKQAVLETCRQEWKKLVSRDWIEADGVVFQDTRETDDVQNARKVAGELAVALANMLQLCRRPIHGETPPIVHQLRDCLEFLSGDFEGPLAGKAEVVARDLDQLSVEPTTWQSEMRTRIASLLGRIGGSFGWRRYGLAMPPTQLNRAMAIVSFLVGPFPAVDLAELRRDGLSVAEAIGQETKRMQTERTMSSDVRLNEQRAAAFARTNVG